MSTQRYSVTPHPIETLLTWVKSGEIAIPEIQRPFVWEPTKVRNLLDSLYQGYPVGYLIAWRNPTVKLKDGTPSAGKRILIDGQQRVTALMAGLLGREVLTKDYETIRIRMAFHPLLEKFEVANPAIRKDVAWIEDVAAVFAPEADLIELTEGYAAKNPEADRPRPSPWTLTPWRDPTSSRNTDNRTSPNRDPYVGEGEATPTACPRTPKSGADWPQGTFAIRRKGPSC